MASRAWTIGLLAVVGVGLITFPAPAGPPLDAAEGEKSAKHPPVFSDLSYAEALAANKGPDKLLLVKATAEWCGPCKAMNRTTFVDPTVVKWIGDNGAAIELDVDRSPKEAEELSIRAMPTMVLFRDGKEIGRTVGYKNAAGLLSWMEDAKAGRNPGDDLAVRVEKARKGEGRVGMQERMGNARTLVMNGKFDDATDEYLWLWKNIVKEEPAMIGVRGSFLAGDIGRLIQQHKPAREAFAALRDQAEERLKGENKSWDDLDDWIVLNEQLDQTDRTLAWFDRIKNDADASKTLKRFSFRIERLLEENNRLGDLGKLEKNPVAKIRSEHAMIKMLPAMEDPEMRKMVEESHARMFRNKAATVYTSLLLAGREDDAAKVASEAFTLEDSPELRFEMARKAADNNASRPIHLEWLRGDDKQEGIADLRADIERQVGRVN